MFIELIKLIHYRIFVQARPIALCICSALRIKKLSTFFSVEKPGNLFDIPDLPSNSE